MKLYLVSIFIYVYIYIYIYITYIHIYIYIYIYIYIIFLSELANDTVKLLDAMKNICLKPINSHALCPKSI